MAAVTASTMILAALRHIGEKAPGGTLDSNEQTAYLSDLNSFLDSLSLESLMIPYLTEDNYSLTSGDGTYTIGRGGDINTDRPLKIEQAWVRDSSSNDYPIDIVEAEEYNLITRKGTSATYPSHLYYDSGFTYTGQGATGVGIGVGTIKLYPLPGSGLTLYLSSTKLLQRFGGIDVPLQLPPGYQRFIEYNFAIDAAGDLPIPANVVKVARDSKAAIQGHNATAPMMRLDYGVAGRRRFDIYSDT